MLVQESGALELERKTINLWPNAGRALGLSKNATYEAAKRGEITGVIRIGKRFLVLRAPFERMLQGESVRGATG
jgi:hypothetical protein